MKTISIVKFTGEMELKEITTQDAEGLDVIQEVESPVYEVASMYTCEDGEENALLSRARLTAEIWTMTKEGEFTARIKA